MKGIVHKDVPVAQITALALSVQRGETEGTALICSLDMLIKKYGRSYASHYPTLSEEDLYLCGVIGVITAARRYDASRKVPFIKYVRPWIRKYIREEVLADSCMRIPISEFNSKRTREAATLALKSCREYSPYTDDLSEAEEQVVAVDVEESLKGLSRMERRLVVAYYGISGIPFAEICAQENICREYGKNICNAAIKKLRNLHNRDTTER